MKKLLILFVLGLAFTAHAQDNAVTLSEFIRFNEGFSTLTAVLEETGLDATLREAGPFTLFAPTDAAFAAMPAGRRNALLGNPQALKAFLKRLIVLEELGTGELYGFR